MLYFKALIHGLDDMPPADLEIRAALEAEAREKGWPAMHAELARVDPVTAARLPPNDAQRIQRALEVQRSSGRPLSSFHTSKPIADNDRLTLGMPLISLEPIDRAWLHERIARRFDAMLAAGFLDEVLRLRARGDLNPDLPSMRCVGYRQAWELLDEHRARTGEVPFPMTRLRELGINATRQLAKRQITWLRSMPARHVVACDSPDAVAQVLAKVAQLLARSGAA
jgi:tRNA dimethylallyltransferase